MLHEKSVFSCNGKLRILCSFAPSFMERPMSTDAAKYEARLGSDRMLPLVFRMALPSVAAQIVNLLYNIVDRIFIGRIPDIGTDALAGVGVTGSVIILISAFSMIVGGGAAPLASIALGQGNRERAGRILGNGFLLLAIFSVVTAGLVYLFMEPLLMLTGASENTIGYATDYLRIYLAGTIFVQMAAGLNSFISAQGRPGIAMLSTVIGALTNLVLDPVFIFALDMGVKGAALATVISQAFSALWVLGFLFSPRASLRLDREHLRLERKVILAIFSLGVAPFVMAGTESIVGFVLNGSLKHYGDIYVSTLTILQSAMMFGSVPITGFAQGFIPVISYNFGQGNGGRVKECFRIAVITMFSFNFVLMFLMVLFPGTVASFFTEDPLLTAHVVEMAPYFLTGAMIFGLQRACQNTFIALGQAKISLFIALLRKVFLLVPLAMLLPRAFGVEGVYLAESVADATAAICCITIFAFTFKKILARGSGSAGTDRKS